MFQRHLFIAAVAMTSATTALAAQNATKPAPAAAAQQQVPTRATLAANLDTGFKAIDTNKDGSLSSTELAAAESKGLQQRAAALRARVEQEFTKLDTNKNGSLDKAEFAAAIPANVPAANGAALVSRLDANKDGKVSADEYKRPQLEVFDRIDTNKDGTLSPTERQAAAQAAKK